MIPLPVIQSEDLSKEKNEYKGSVTFQTDVMNTEEVVLFVKGTVANGIDIETALDDMHMIDNMLLIRRNHLIASPSTAKTSAGYFRKNNTIYDMYDKILDARVKADHEKALKTKALNWFYNILDDFGRSQFPEPKTEEDILGYYQDPGYHLPCEPDTFD